jgi:hypothetical protein
MRTYYDGIPDVIQVGEHQFAERRLIQLWITLMLVSWQVILLGSRNIFHELTYSAGHQLLIALVYTTLHSLTPFRRATGLLVSHSLPNMFGMAL